MYRWLERCLSFPINQRFGIHQCLERRILSMPFGSWKEINQKLTYKKRRNMINLHSWGLKRIIDTARMIQVRSKMVRGASLMLHALRAPDVSTWGLEHRQDEISGVAWWCYQWHKLPKLGTFWWLFLKLLRWI